MPGDACRGGSASSPRRCAAPGRCSRREGRELRKPSVSAPFRGGLLRRRRLVLAISVGHLGRDFVRPEAHTCSMADGELIRQAYRYQLAPTPEQAALLASFTGASRFW